MRRCRGTLCGPATVPMTKSAGFAETEIGIGVAPAIFPSAITHADGTLGFSHGAGYGPEKRW